MNFETTRKIAAIIGCISIVIFAIVGIVSIWGGDYNELTSKLMLTSLVTLFTSLTSLAIMNTVERRK